MARGKGVRLQRYKDGGVLDLKTFAMADGPDLGRIPADRTFVKTREELAEWIGDRATAGRMVPKGFPRSASSAETCSADRLADVQIALRRRGVRLQKYKDGGVLDLKTFTVADGAVLAGLGRPHVHAQPRGTCGMVRRDGPRPARLVPKGFPRTGKFG